MIVGSRYRDCHIHPKREAGSDKVLGGQHMEYVTYQLRVKSGSHIVSMLVGSRWKMSHAN
jgi:hypothetical protein